MTELENLKLQLADATIRNAQIVMQFRMAEAALKQSQEELQQALNAVAAKEREEAEDDGSSGEK